MKQDPFINDVSESINIYNETSGQKKSIASDITQPKLSASLNDQTEIERNSRKQTILGLSLMLLSGLLYSGLTTLVKWATILGYSSAEVIVYRSSIQIIIASLQYCIKRRKWQNEEKEQQKQILSPKQIASIIGNAIFGALATIASFEGAALCPVGDNVSLKSLTAVTTAFAGYIILKEKITIIHYVALVFAMGATILITQPPMIFEGVSIHDNFQKYSAGYITSIIAALCQSGVYVCIKLAGTVSVVILILSRGIISFISGILLIVFYFKEIHPMQHWQDIVCIVTICLIGYGAQYSLTKGGQLVIVGLASLLRATDIGWCFLWEIIFFSTMPNYLTIIGAVTMFLSVLLVAIEKIKKSQQENQMNNLNIQRQTVVSIHTYTPDAFVASDRCITSTENELRASLSQS